MTPQNAFFVNFENITTDHLGQKNQLETKICQTYASREKNFLKSLQRGVHLQNHRVFLSQILLKMIIHTAMKMKMKIHTA